MSVFLALDLDEPTRARVADVIERARATLEARWVRADKLHLTLVFLGNPTEQHVQTLIPLIDEVATRHAPFHLSLRGSGTFGTARAPSVLWLGVDGELEPLRALQRDCSDQLLALELPGVQAHERQRPYAPHVTLARSKMGHPFGDLQATLRDFSSAPFPVEHLTLYESTSDTYRPLSRTPLRGRR